MKILLIIFTRFPLIPALGAEGAADLQRQMTEHTVNVTRPLMDAGISSQVRYEGGAEDTMVQWLGNDLLFAPQGEGDLGLGQHLPLLGTTVGRGEQRRPAG